MKVEGVCVDGQSIEPITMRGALSQSVASEINLQVQN